MFLMRRRGQAEGRDQIEPKKVPTSTFQQDAKSDNAGAATAYPPNGDKKVAFCGSLRAIPTQTCKSRSLMASTKRTISPCSSQITALWPKRNVSASAMVCLSYVQIYP